MRRRISTWKEHSTNDLLVSVETQGVPTTRSTLYCNGSAQDDNFNDPLAMNVEWFNLSRDAQTSIGSGSIALTPQRHSQMKRFHVKSHLQTLLVKVSLTASIVIENTLHLSMNSV